MVDVVFVSMCDGVVGVICNVEEGGCLLKKVGGAMWIKPYVVGGIDENEGGRLKMPYVVGAYWKR